MPPRPASIKVRALQWLAQREHSRVELRDKLLRLLSRSAPGVSMPASADRMAHPHGAGLDSSPDRSPDTDTDPAAEVEALLQWLELRGYLSPERFIESRVHARQSRFGNLRIKQELQHHGLSLDADTRQSLQQSELGRAREVWRKKYAAPATDTAGRLRQMRFLAGRGFSMDVVRQVLQGGAGLDDDLDSELPPA